MLRPYGEARAPAIQRPQGATGGRAARSVRYIGAEGEKPCHKDSRGQHSSSGWR
jgi:hypothetical protein